MPRNLDSTFIAGLGLPSVQFALFAAFVFRSGPRFVWTGPGPYQFSSALATQLTASTQAAITVTSSSVFGGIGSFGKVGGVIEGSDGKAEGTTVTLSGIDPVYLAESMTDIQMGAPAAIWLAQLSGQMLSVGTPYLWFLGQVDAPPVAVGADQMAITLALENKLVNHERPPAYRYTAADQNMVHPTDSAFDHVEELNDQALLWG